MPLKELQWLTPFDEGSRATSSARTWMRRVRMAHASECKLFLECYCACRRYQGRHCGERRLRYVAAFVGQLSDKPLLACDLTYGVLLDR